MFVCSEQDLGCATKILSRMARLYADEDFDYPVVVELRRLGHDVLTTASPG